jgi:pilus assembly protein FimV
LLFSCNAIDLLREKGTMLRKIVVILTMLLCSMATQLYALGLGSVTVESSLNQPLRMRIELLQLGDTRLQDIRVSMASGDDFERFNIERDGFLSNIRFSVESTADGNVVILTSSQIVREPYLSFILDTRWPNGRLLSEHTVLLDLPVFNDQQTTPEVRQPISPVLQPPSSSQTNDATPFVDSSASPAVAVASSSSSSAANLQPEVIAAEPEEETAQIAEETPAAEEEAVAEQPVEAAVEPEPEATPEPEVEAIAAEPEVEAEAIEAAAEPVAPEVVEPETIETDSSDTLSDIALQVRPNTTVTMQQTMLAIQELNPDAFADGNINRLLSGQVLRVPNLEEIQAIDPRDAVDEVNRQNQEFSAADVQPLAAPSNASSNQDDQPQGQLSVVSSDEAIDASSGATGLGDAENEALDQRIAELENELAQRQEEADRARIEREELDSRMADLEEQIAAAQEIIRLQDIQLAQLQESLAEAAAEAQLLAEQQAVQAAAQIEAAQPVDSSPSFFDDLLRILTGNAIFMIFGIVLVILLLVVLMLRRNRGTKKDDDHDIDEIAEQDFAVQSSEDSKENSKEDESATEFQDYDSSDLDSELDDIIGVSDEAEAAEEEFAAAEEEASDEPQLDVLSIVNQLVAEQQYRRALSMLNTSLAEQGENEEVRARIAEVESLLAEEDAGQSVAEVSEAQQSDEREAETKSFLDDLGIDLDSFDYDEDSSEEPVEASPSAEEKEKAAEAPEEDAESDDVDMMFDLGGEDEAEEIEQDADASEEDGEEEAFEFDLDDDANAVESEAKDPEDIDIDTLEFDADAVEEVKADVSSTEDEEIDLETFSFDADAAASITEKAEAENANEPAVEEDDPNALEFSFDKEEIEQSAEALEPASNEEVETFDFDLDDNSGDTVLEKPASEEATAAEDGAEDFDFDLDEFEVEPEEVKVDEADDSDDNFLDLDAEMDGSKADITEIVADSDEIEFDIDTDDESAPSDESPKQADEPTAESDEFDLIGDDDLEFLSDDDVELESVEDAEEIDVLSDDDEAATKLELAYAYQKMGDTEGAKEILQEVIKEGSDEQIDEATKLLGSLEGKSD